MTNAIEHPRLPRLSHIYPDWHRDDTGSWHAERDTSREVAAALWLHAAYGLGLRADTGIPDADTIEPLADHLWHEPTDSDARVIEALAWSIADDETETLYWGCEPLTRLSI